MLKKEEEIIEELKNLIIKKFSDEATGHDYHHIMRVYKLGLSLAKKEGADLFITGTAALFHDIDDHKFNGGDWEANQKTAEHILGQFEIEESKKSEILDIVAHCSYKGAGVEDAMNSLEGKCVQDADRIDAIGAIGIARTFAYGGAVGQPIYDPTIKPEKHQTKEAYYEGRTNTVNHFYEKLLLLKDRMHTETGKEIAQERHEFMESFLKQFYREWEGG